MSVRAGQFHHTGVLVADLERTARFYVDAFGGRLLNRPVLVEGDDAAGVFGGPDGIAFRFSYIGFEQGAVELMEFVGDVRPEWARTPQTARLPHFGLRVDDFDEAVARVAPAGGTVLWSSVKPWGDARVMYVADPDGNVIELFDQDLGAIVGATADLFPDSRI